MPEAVIVSTARSPIGRAYKGSMTTIRPDDLAVQMIKAAVGKAGLTGDQIEDLALGCAEPHDEDRLSAVDAAKTKWWSAHVQNEILDACVQLHGGYGYMNEYRVARAWRDARVTKIWAGSNEIMKELIGRDLGL